MNTNNFIVDSNRTNQGQKRRRLHDSIQNDDQEQKRTSLDLSTNKPSSRTSSTPSNNFSRRISPSSTPLICVSLSEDETMGTASEQQNEVQFDGASKNDTIEQNTSGPISAVSIENNLQNSINPRRNPRKPNRQKPVQLLPNGSSPASLTVSVKGEPCDTDENSVTQDSSFEDPVSSQGKKIEHLLMTSGLNAQDLLELSKSSKNSTNAYQWLQQAFRSLMPTHAQMNSADMNGSYNIPISSSGKFIVNYSITFIHKHFI